MKTKDLEPGMVVAVGSVQDFENGWCQRAMVVEVGNWEADGRFHRIIRRPGATGIALAIAYQRDGKPTEWNRVVKLANQIRCTWEAYLEHGELVEARKAQALKAKAQGEARRDELVKKLSELLGVPCRVAFERIGGNYVPGHIAINFSDAESLVDTL